MNHKDRFGCVLEGDIFVKFLYQGNIEKCFLFFPYSLKEFV